MRGLTKARILIIGSTETTDQTSSIKRYNTKMKSKSATIRLKAIDLCTGHILATSSRSAQGEGLLDDMASVYAVKKTLKQMLGEKKGPSGDSSPGPFLHQLEHSLFKNSNISCE